MGQFSPEVQEKYFSFGFVRNPWDIAVSEYFYNVKNHGERRSFKDFLKLPRAGLYHLKPQHEFFNRNVNFIGRFENLQEDFNFVCDTIEIPRGELSHQNKSTHNPYWDYYDDESRQLIARRFNKDIEYFNYEFSR